MAGAPVRWEPGEILELLDLIGEHEEAFVYDWRNRFGTSLESVFDGSMSWHEAYSLTLELAKDPSSRVGAALVGWQFPLSMEAMAMGVRPSERNLGTVQTLSQDRIRDHLASLGHGRGEDSNVVELPTATPASSDTAPTPTSTQTNG